MFGLRIEGHHPKKDFRIANQIIGEVAGWHHANNRGIEEREANNTNAWVVDYENEYRKTHRSTMLAEARKYVTGAGGALLIAGSILYARSVLSRTSIPETPSPTVTLGLTPPSDSSNTGWSVQYMPRHEPGIRYVQVAESILHDHDVIRFTQQDQSWWQYIPQAIPLPFRPNPDPATDVELSQFNSNPEILIYQSSDYFDPHEKPFPVLLQTSSSGKINVSVIKFTNDQTGEKEYVGITHLPQENPTFLVSLFRREHISLPHIKTTSKQKSS